VDTKKEQVDQRQDEELNEIQEWRKGINRVVHGDDQFQWKGIMVEHRDLKDHVVTVEGTLTELLVSTKATANFVKWVISIVGGIGTVLGILKVINVI
jgi:hypothetical protein